MAQRRRNGARAAPRQEGNDPIGRGLQRRRENADPLDDEYRRPENAPSFEPDCPICFEPLFNADGIAPVNKEVAKIMCLHLVHSDCLVAAGKALNSDGTRYGVGWMGPRCACPICDMAVSSWISYRAAADFPIFWMHRIQVCLEEIGPRGGPVSIDRVKEMLKADSSLTRKQKEYLVENHQGTDANGFTEALKMGDMVWVVKDVNGGPNNGGYTFHGYKQGCWDLDRNRRKLWLHKWGPNPDPPRPVQQQQQRQLSESQPQKQTAQVFQAPQRLRRMANPAGPRNLREEPNRTFPLVLLFAFFLILYLVFCFLILLSSEKKLPLNVEEENG